MERTIKSFVDSKNKLMKNFECDGEYFVKILDECFWRIKNTEGIYFLTYWKEGGKLNECIIVKRGNRPIITRKNKYTMIIVIECVKIALILKNSMEV